MRLRCLRWEGRLPIHVLLVYVTVTDVLTEVRILIDVQGSRRFCECRWLLGMRLGWWLRIHILWELNTLFWNSVTSLNNWVLSLVCWEIKAVSILIRENVHLLVSCLYIVGVNVITWVLLGRLIHDSFESWAVLSPPVMNLSIIFRQGILHLLFIQFSKLA